MPLISLVPRSKEIEQKLSGSMERIRKALKHIISITWGIPQNDVLINLIKCPYKDADSDMADAVLYLETSPDKKLIRKADILRKEIKEVLRRDLATFEVWVRFIPGSWGDNTQIE